MGKIDDNNEKLKISEKDIADVDNIKGFEISEKKIADIDDTKEFECSKKDIAANKFGEKIETKDALLKLIRYSTDKNASDIHIEPYSETEIGIRIRIDGKLEKYDINLVNTKGIYKGEQFISIVKHLSRIPPDIKSIPQDGRISLEEFPEYNFRVSTIPIKLKDSKRGITDAEGIVIRIHNIKKIQELSEIFENFEELKKKWERNLSASNGLILVTGPTGSGKNSTIYSSTKYIITKNKLNNILQLKIITTEDPVEVMLEGVQQIGINKKIGLTFEKSLEHILRHDPDIIFIGEIRSVETAKMAIRASMTGHLVLSTLHTNNSISAISRLLNLGIKKDEIAENLRCVLSQRLIRKIKSDFKCDKKNCLKNCQNFSGRTAVFELLEIEEKVKKEITKSENFNMESNIISILKENNFATLKINANVLKEKNITCAKEIEKIC